MTDTSAFLELYDDTLPHVYGYLARRCANAATAEDLTAETFMAAVAALHNSNAGAGGNRLDLNIPWLDRHRPPQVDRPLETHGTSKGRARRTVGRHGDDDPTDAAIEVASAQAVLPSSHQLIAPS